MIEHVRRPGGALEIQSAGERLWLLPQRAAYWPRRNTLLIADAHLGKAAAFRRAGVPVPSGTTDENLQRLTGLLGTLGAERIVFLGDLLHSRVARESSAAGFRSWRQQHGKIDMTLVRGNHDSRAGDPPCEWRVDCVDDPLIVDGIALCHLPRSVPGHYGIAGHTHPAVRLTGRGGEHLRLPCFLFTADYAVLPAFGPFTGMADVEPRTGERVYVVAGEQVISAADNRSPAADNRSET
jgi:uncharacterized protein